MRTMKKLSTMLLIIVLCASLTACGNNDDSAAPQDESTITDTQDGAETQTDAKVQTADGVTILTSTDIQDGEYYDFGIQVDLDYDAVASMERINEDKLSGYTGDFEAKLNNLARSIGGNWDVMCDYDDDPEFGEMLMADAIRNGNTDDAYLQLGCYYDTDNGEYVYYVGYCSANMAAFDQGIEQTAKDIKTLFGVTVDKDKLKNASEDAFEKVQNNGDYYIYEQDAAVEREDCNETVALTMEVGYPDEGSDMIGYVYCERSRVYK